MDANTIIKGRKVTKVSYENEIEQILKEYGINVDSLKIKSSKERLGLDRNTDG